MYKHISMVAKPSIKRPECMEVIVHNLTHYGNDFSSVGLNGRMIKGVFLHKTVRISTFAIHSDDIISPYPASFNDLLFRSEGISIVFEIIVAIPNLTKSIALYVRNEHWEPIKEAVEAYNEAHKY